MLKPTFKVSVKTIEENQAEVIISPLPKNFGHTIGNALRRVMLNSLSGGAITKIKIARAAHQFSTLKGMKEDVLEFILNLKELNFALETDDEVTAKLSVSGKKVVTAKNIELPAGVTLANPDHVLANLTDAASKLSATITIVKGIGYVPAEEFSTNEAGVIPLDASFSPIVNVTYTVESTRVGRRTDLDKVRIHLTTNGTIEPETAVKQASQILTKFFEHIHSPAETEEEVVEDKISNLPDGFVEDLELSTRITNALKKGGYERLSDFASTSISDLKQVKNLGEKSVLDIAAKLADKDIIIK